MAPAIKLGMIAPYAGDLATSSAFMSELAGLLEECEVESLWAVEHVIEADHYKKRYPYSKSGEMPGRLTPMTDPLETLAFMAALTSTVRLATGVIIAPLHSPAVLAKRVATLDRLSDERFMLGLGIGWQREEYEAVGATFGDRGRQLDECIGAMRCLWTETPATYDGRYVRFESVHSVPRPRRSVPIVLGGKSVAAVQRCGRVADGWYPWVVSPEEFAAGTEVLAAAAADAGRSIDDLELTVCPLSYDPSRQTDLAFVRQYVGAGAQRLIIHSGISGPDELGVLRDRLLGYRDSIIDRL